VPRRCRCFLMRFRATSLSLSISRRVAASGYATSRVSGAISKTRRKQDTLNLSLYALPAPLSTPSRRRHYIAAMMTTRRLSGAASPSSATNVSMANARRSSLARILAAIFSGYDIGAYLLLLTLSLGYLYVIVARGTFLRYACRELPRRLRLRRYDDARRRLDRRGRLRRSHASRDGLTITP